MNGRNFTASLKPVWSEIEIINFLNQMKGTATVWAINHDKDTDENGQLIDPHTHILIEYSTPRKVSTVANLLGVENNFIELVKNKKGMLRYLTHMDETDKHRYDDDEVYTNSEISYTEMIKGSGMSDKEIAEYIQTGRAMELLGLVSSQRIRTIQSILHYENSNLTLRELKRLNQKMDDITTDIIKVKEMAIDFATRYKDSTEMLVGGLMSVAEALSNATLKLGTTKIVKR